MLQIYRKRREPPGDPAWLQPAHGRHTYAWPLRRHPSGGRSDEVTPRRLGIAGVPQ